MQSKILASMAVVAVGTLIATVVVAQAPPTESALTRTRYLPEYTASGDLVLPKNFHEWIYVGSPWCIDRVSFTNR
jgi:hypothetical protein